MGKAGEKGPRENFVSWLLETVTIFTIFKMYTRRPAVKNLVPSYCLCNKIGFKIGATFKIFNFVSQIRIIVLSWRYHYHYLH